MLVDKNNILRPSEGLHLIFEEVQVSKWLKLLALLQLNAGVEKLYGTVDWKT